MAQKLNNEKKVRNGLGSEKLRTNMEISVAVGQRERKRQVVLRMEKVLENGGAIAKKQGGKGMV